MTRPVSHLVRIAVFAILVVPACLAQLTPEQKAADFRYLAGLYAKQYAPYEWKRTLFGFDALDIAPWMERVARTKDDLDFYEVCVEYISKLNDSHVPFVLPSNFVATLNFTVDIYDGKVLIDSINRTRLPAAGFPFQIGDELLSVDGKDAEQLIAEFSKYAPAGNPRSLRRQAAARIVTRPQSRMPHAPDVGDSASVSVLLAGGETRTFDVPWVKTGVPLHVGPVPSPKSAPARKAMFDGTEELPEYLQVWMEAQHSAADHVEGVLGLGARTPVFVLPANFVQRRGMAPADFFFSGSYTAGGRRIGFIRIPNYGSLAPSVLQEFEGEIAWFQENTDGLVVDNMRNTGGFLCFGENLVARLTPYQFRATTYELRATWSRVNSFYSALSSARQFNADKWMIDLYEILVNDLLQAYQENRGRTGPIPLCTPSGDRLPATDQSGRMIAYTKPLIMLIDDFSISTADSVPAMLQDARRGPLFGWRTNGAGGTNITPAAGAYSEALSGVVLGMMVRREPVVTPGYPTSHYIENAGVAPDIEYDFMTKENLLQRGRPFVDAFTAAMIQEISGGR
jgi:hypothetical protein